MAEKTIRIRKDVERGRMVVQIQLEYYNTNSPLEYQNSYVHVIFYLQHGLVGRTLHFCCQKVYSKWWFCSLRTKHISTFQAGLTNNISSTELKTTFKNFTNFRV